EILTHGQVREHLASLGNEAEPGLRHPIRRQAMDRTAVEADRAALRRRDAHDRADRRGLAHTVPAEQGDDVARAGAESDAEPDLAHTLRRLVRIYGEHQACYSSSWAILSSYCRR